MSHEDQRSQSAAARAAAAVACALIVVMGACAPQAGPGAGSTAADNPAAKKVLTLAHQVEPVGFILDVRGGTEFTSGPEVQYIMHDALSVEIEYQNWVGQVATELPSIEKGTWRLNADGTMETTWHLRPNVKWHDGHPFTSADLMFTFDVNKDPEVADRARGARPSRVMDAASAPDDLTFIIHWSTPYVTAYREAPGELLPRHILEDLFLNDKANFSDSRFFTTEFVGLGPYKLVSWERGSYIEAARFDDYYLGRPPLDTVIVRFVGDPNTAVANIMSGTVDAVLSQSTEGLDLDAAFEVKRRWEGTGNQVATNNTGRVYVAQAQYRPENAKPRNGVSQLAVRQALSHSIDRQTLADVMTHGLSPGADSYVPTIDPERPDLESSIRPYPYDTARALQLLSDAGWVRGQDGVLTNRDTGDRFELEIWARQGSGNDRMITAIADGWKGVGAAMTIYVIPTALRGNPEVEATRPGYLIINPSGRAYLDNDLMHSREIPTAATRWRGNNYGGYINPNVDGLVDQLHTVIDPRQRLPLEQQLVAELTGDAAMLPLYWQVVPVLMLQGVKGPRPKYKSPTANMFEWDKE